MKIIACLDSNEDVVWLAFPSSTSEINAVLNEKGFQPLDQDGIEYEDGVFPDWSNVTPFWRTDEFGGGLVPANT